MDVIDGRSQAEQLIQQGRYVEATTIYEQLIEVDPETLRHYGGLGIALLLQGQEADAQMVWMTPMMDADPNQVEAWTMELAKMLEVESDRQSAAQNYQNAWVLRQHLREVVPNDIENSLHILCLTHKAGWLELDSVLLMSLTEALPSYLNQLSPDLQDSCYKLLLDAIAAVLQPRFGQMTVVTFDFLKTSVHCLAKTSHASFLMDLLLNQSNVYADQSLLPSVVAIARLCLLLNPTNPTQILAITSLLLKGETSDMEQGVNLLAQHLTPDIEPLNKVSFTHSMLMGLLRLGCRWPEVTDLFQQHVAALEDWVQAQSHILQTEQSLEALSPDEKQHCRILTTGSQLHYFADDPAQYRTLRNQLARQGQIYVRRAFPQNVEQYQTHQQRRFAKAKPDDCLKIGYLSDCFRYHSVGWLCRWLLQSHNPHQFEVHLYSSQASDDLLQQQFIQQHGDRFHSVSSASSEIADCIDHDNIDILIDLDSLTTYHTSGAMVLKPAPVQVSWLGFDAPGFPAVDYFIVDPYVVTENAQDYYTETLWRLPQTYLAVEGFEVGTPSLRRDHLDIPSDAVVYLSSQTGFKRHPDTIRLQMQIVKNVPNSYFLIKSFGAKLSNLQEYFMQLAAEEGLDRDRLRFLPDVSSSLIHRANLLLADIVLDTYPYNGATTTLETLWMGIPLVTRVGEQFAARNSYTMLKNVGVEEGIAWSAKEYVDWGIRFGIDEILRRQVSWKLHQSRRSTPLWNVRQFTLDMETAYQQMWQRYCDTKR